MLVNDITLLGNTCFSLNNIHLYNYVYPANSFNDYRSTGRPKNNIHLVTSGERYYEIGGKEFTCKKNELIFIPDGTRYYTCNSENCSGIGVMFDFDRDTAVKPDVYHNWVDERGDYLRLLKRLEDSLITTPKSVVHHISLLFRIIDHMTAEISKNDKYMQIVSPAMDLLKQRFNENIPVSEYARACNISETYLRQIFKKLLGMSPIDYRNSLRFAEARKLKQQGMLVTEIAERCGFCDVTYFSRLFKRQTGESINGCSDMDLI